MEGWGCEIAHFKSIESKKWGIIMKNVALLAQMIDGLGLMALMAIITVLILLLACSALFSSIMGSFREKREEMLAEDAERCARNQIRRLNGWKPSEGQIEMFQRSELDIQSLSGSWRGQSEKYYNTLRLTAAILYLVALNQEDSSLLYGLARYKDRLYEVVLARFYWQGTWWILFHDDEATKNRPLRAIKESHLNKTWFGDDIIAMRTIAFSKIINYFR